MTKLVKECCTMDSQIFPDSCPLAGVVLLKDTLLFDGAFLVSWLVREACLGGMKARTHA